MDAPFRRDALSCVLFLTTAIACAGDQPATRGAVSGAIAFGDLFVLDGQTELEQPGDVVLSALTDVVMWNGALVVVDGRESNAKVYDLGGRLVRVIGRRGHGPGELSDPFAAAPLADGRIAILDHQLRLSLFSSTGEYETRWQLAGGDAASLAPMDGGAGLLVGVRMRAEDANGNPGEYHLHHLDLNGDRIQSFREVATTTRLYEVNFQAVFGAALGGTVVSVARNSNRVHHFDLDTGRERWSEAGTGAYRPPAWPTQPIADMEEMTRWVNAQMWTFDILPLDSAHYLVRFSSPQPLTNSRGWAYSIASVDGREIATIAHAEPRIDLVHAGRAYSIDIRPDGRSWLSAYELAELGSPASPAPGR